MRKRCSQTIKILFCLVFLSGCATLPIERRLERVELVDGVDAKEARILAEKALIDKGVAADYQLNTAMVLDADEKVDPRNVAGTFVINSQFLRYPGCWIIRFSPKKDNSSNVHDVIIEKSSGNMVAVKESSLFHSFLTFMTGFMTDEPEEIGGIMSSVCVHASRGQWPATKDELADELQKLTETSPMSLTGFPHYMDFKVENNGLLMNTKDYRGKVIVNQRLEVADASTHSYRLIHGSFNRHPTTESAIEMTCPQGIDVRIESITGK